MPIEKLIADINPVQDLHGYDSPWPAGGGKNKLPNDATTSTIQGVTFTVNADKTITANGTSTGWTGLTVSTFTLPAGEYKLVSLVKPAYAYNYYLSLNKSGTAVASTSSNPNGVAFTLTEETTLVCKLFARPNNALSNFVCYPMIILATETDVSYLPYSNECPISGWTGLEGIDTGKNLFDPSLFTGKGWSESDGVYTGSSQAIDDGYLPNILPLAIPKGQRITLSCDYINSTASRAGYFYIKYDDGSSNYAECKANKSDWTHIALTSTDGKNVESVYFGASNTVTFSLKNIQIEFSTAETAFAEFSGASSLSVNWQDTAGTVYGGNLTVNEDGSGVLTADCIGIDLSTITDWQVERNMQRIFIIRNDIAPASSSSTVADKLICNRFKSISFDQLYGNKEQGVAISIDKALQLHINGLTDDPNVTLAIVNQYFQDNQTFVVAKLATPVVHHLPSVEMLSTVLGTNNIWVDTGDVTVTYQSTSDSYDDTVPYSFDSPLGTYNQTNLHLFNETFIENGMGD